MLPLISPKPRVGGAIAKGVRQLHPHQSTDPRPRT